MLDWSVCEGVWSVPWFTARLTSLVGEGLVYTMVLGQSVCDGVWSILWLSVCLTGRDVRGSGLFRGYQYVCLVGMQGGLAHTVVTRMSYWVVGEGHNVVSSMSDWSVGKGVWYVLWLPGLVRLVGMLGKVILWRRVSVHMHQLGDVVVDYK